jgi:hypothetical protein
MMIVLFWQICACRFRLMKIEIIHSFASLYFT